MKQSKPLLDESHPAAFACCFLTKSSANASLAQIPYTLNVGAGVISGLGSRAGYQIITTAQARAPCRWKKCEHL
jgi:hypothetical protein